MKTINLGDLKLKVLDPEDYKLVVERLKQEKEKRFQKYMGKFVENRKNGAQFNPVDFFYSASVFEDQIADQPMDFNLRNLELYIQLTDQLGALDKTYWEPPLLNGRNILSGSKVREDYLISNRKFNSNPKMILLSEGVEGLLKESEKYLTQAISIFDDYLTNQNQQNNNLSAFKSQIETYLGQSIRRQIFFPIITKRNVSDDAIIQAVNRGGPLLEHFESMTQNNIFLDDYSAAVFAASFANAMKLDKEMYIRSLGIFGSVIPLVGNNQTVTESIDFLKKSMKDDSPWYINLN